MERNQLPTVAIVGRTNVGKSTLFNRLVKGARNIIFDAPGVTRDPLKEVVEWAGCTFQLVDTGGIGTGLKADSIEGAVCEQALAMAKEADFVLFVCDGTIGVLPEDKDIARRLQRNKVPVKLYVNKCDTLVSQEYLHEFARLGYGDAIQISAAHGTGVSDLLSDIVAEMQRVVPSDTVPHEEIACSVAIIGRPNVGKSSLMNRLLGKNRSIVTDVPGTTREAIADHVRFYSEEIKLVDTAGMRRKSAVSEALEQRMVKSSLRAVDAADIVVLVIDASEGRLADQELKLAFYALQERKKGLILAFNKVDLIDQEKRDQIELQLEKYAHLDRKVARLYFSCKDGKNLGKILPLVQQVNERRRKNFTPEELHQLFLEALIRRPLYRHGQHLRLHKVRQIAENPAIIRLDINLPAMWFNATHSGFFENVLRRKYELSGAPIQITARHKGRLPSAQ